MNNTPDLSPDKTRAKLTWQERLKPFAELTLAETSPKRKPRKIEGLKAIWRMMLQRCLNANGKKYPDYGGRGITVCERWKSFEFFKADMGEKPEGMSLERRNNDGDYSPENCYWATAKEQRVNQRIAWEIIMDKRNG